MSIVKLHNEEACLKDKLENILIALGLDVSQFDSVSIGFDNIKSNHEHNVVVFDNGCYYLWYFERGSKSLASKFESEERVLQHLAKMATYKAAYEFCLKNNLDVNDCSRNAPVYKKQAEMLANLIKNGLIA